MSRYRVVGFALMLCLVLGVSSIQAAGSPWLTWLYESESGRMTMVNESGTMLRQFILPATSGSTYSFKAAVSPDGRYVAYVTNFMPSNAVNPSAGVVALNIYDLNISSLVFVYPLAADAAISLNFHSDVFNYDATSSTFAFGYAAQGINWEILLINLASFTTTSLRADSPVAVAAGIDPGFGFLVPTVQANRNGQIWFTMIPSGTEGSTQYANYVWTPSSGTVTVGDAYVTLDTDTLSLTNEVVTTFSDPRFSNSAWPDTGFPVFNTLQAYNPTTRVRTPFYHTSDQSLYSLHFIQGGERVLVGGYNVTTNARTWQVLERSGAVAGTPAASVPTANITSMAGLLNGFIYTAGTGGTTLFYVETRLAAPPYVASSIWNSSLGAQAIIVWVSDNQAFGATPFAPWGEIIPPTSSSGSGSSGTGVLTINGQARVQTTEGDLLNVRSGPGTTFSRVAQLSNGAVVTLVEGPRSGEGFTWWRIRTDSGMEGWVVERADDVLTLIPLVSLPPAVALLPAPTPLLPANGTVYNVFPRTTTLVWTSVDGATVYIIEIESCLPGTNPLACQPYITTNVTSSQTSYTFNFVGAQPGRWRVWAMDVSSQEGVKSDWWMFTHQQ